MNIIGKMTGLIKKIKSLEENQKPVESAQPDPLEKLATSSGVVFVELYDAKASDIAEELLNEVAKLMEDHIQVQKTLIGNYY